ncbi:hypothetical protein [Sphingomonas hengshuiensis]|uniref:Uncharacterized protein n=1 Tax=Sphingomonas hengshuiensis TaxID=1609977 RepID=A0A7U4JAA1_9SPHN|nr:hypothetical protein [Sphingomonas hengshuiensis]AJP73150.1 hypothetical protein TS85_17155 [Sphingomonas hengshuiensis]
MMAALNLDRRGYRPLYRTGTLCPGCGKGHWIVGRQSAECVRCATALPLAPVEIEPAVPPHRPAWADRP